MYIGNVKCQKRCKRYAINRELYCQWWFRSSFYHEKNQIRNKFLTEGYPMRFLGILMNDFESEELDPMVPGFLFTGFESKPIVLIGVPFCNINEIRKNWSRNWSLSPKKSMTLELFGVVWKTKKVIQLSFWRRKIHIFYVNLYPYILCKIYEEVCSFKETKWNVVTHWNEPENLNKYLQPVKILFQNSDHVFQWKFLNNLGSTYE